MKTVIFISNFMGHGGAARVIATIAESLSNKGYKTIIASFPFDGFEYPVPDDIEMVKLDAGNVSGVRRKIRRIRSIRRLMRAYPDATIIAFEYFVGMEAVVAATGFKCRVIVSERNDPNKVKNKVMCAIRNFLFGRSDFVVCQTDDAKKYFPKRVQKKARVIMNPVKGDLPVWDFNNHNSVIINYCRLEKQKNIPMLIDAFKMVHERYPDYKLLIYGQGKEKDNILSMIEKEGLNDSVSIKPFISEIHDVASKCRMFVSSSDYEGLSNSMLEAMAMGMPVVCTDCPIGGAGMVIENGVNGLLTRVGDAGELAEKMLAVIEDDELAESLSKNAFRIRKQLDVDSITRQWIDII